MSLQLHIPNEILEHIIGFVSNDLVSLLQLRYVGRAFHTITLKTLVREVTFRQLRKLSTLSRPASIGSLLRKYTRQLCSPTYGQVSADEIMTFLSTFDHLTHVCLNVAQESDEIPADSDPLRVFFKHVPLSVSHIQLHVACSQHEALVSNPEVNIRILPNVTALRLIWDNGQLYKTPSQLLKVFLPRMPNLEHLVIDEGECESGSYLFWNHPDLSQLLRECCPKLQSFQSFPDGTRADAALELPFHGVFENFTRVHVRGMAMRKELLEIAPDTWWASIQHFHDHCGDDYNGFSLDHGIDCLSARIACVNKLKNVESLRLPIPVSRMGYYHGDRLEDAQIEEGLHLYFDAIASSCLKLKVLEVSGLPVYAEPLRAALIKFESHAPCTLRRIVISELEPCDSKMNRVATDELRAIFQKKRVELVSKNTLTSDGSDEIMDWVFGFGIGWPGDLLWPIWKDEYEEEQT